MRTRTVLAGLSLAAALACAGAAAAHTSYMLPSVFSTVRGEVVTVQSSFAEDYMFRPEIAVTSQDFHLYRPDGKRDVYDKQETFKQLTVLESDLTEPGTYRFTTGERFGRTGTQIRVNNEWRNLEPGETAPAGAQTVRSQTATVADVYVTKGAPTNAVIGVNVGRLAMRPVTHPNAIYLDEGFTFDVTFDGAPLANQAVEVDREGGGYEEPKFHQVVRTDARGRIVLKFDRPGAYLIMTRHRANAPAGSETPIRSYTTSLTFEVMRD